ncbi:tetratricopeptide repeat protein [Hyphomicrobiales bacterium]|nr:tetratricopeptide repeat protein [Hyphomicrobiales bacterium]
MELTIEQALQQGVAAHKAGKLEEAERLYRAILQSQPKHPDANHNLGILAVSVNKADEALLLFKSALEANPKIEQFWLSYIDALIKEKQFENAKLMIEQAKKQGVSREKVDAIEVQIITTTQLKEPKLVVQKKSLTLLEKRKKLAEQKKREKKARKQNVKGISPSQEQLNSLVEHYQNGRYDDAEKLAKSITQQFPKHQFAWTLLGAVLKQTGRINESLFAKQTAVELEPLDAKAYYNLGITLQELGRLDEAEASYKQAIALKPDFAEVHYNLGNTLKELGRLEEALASYTQAIALKPDFAEAHSNLGVTLKELGRLEEALASYTQAIALKTDYAEAHSNLGITLQEFGRLEEAEVSYNQAIALKPDFAEAILNLSIIQSYMNDLEAEIVSLQNVLRIDSDDYGLRAGVSLAICNFLEGDFAESKKHLLAATKIQEKKSSESQPERVYWTYLSNILKWHKNKYLGVKKGKNDKNLYVVGESHSLSSHHLCIQKSGVNFFCSTKLIKGCKQWHLGNSFRNQYKHQFETIFFALPKHSYVLVAIGEIDCRLDTGIIAHKKKFPEKQIKEIISNTIENYLNYIVNNNSDYQHNVTIQGVPCPNLDVRNHSEKDIRQLGEVIKIFNYELEMQSKEKGFGFLDTHQLTNKGDGMSNGCWHIDDYHLSPEGMQEAWRRYGSDKSYEQF